MLILRVLGKYFDVKGAFLHGQFTNENHIFIELPQGQENLCPKNFALELLATLNGLNRVRLHSL